MDMLAGVGLAVAMGLQREPAGLVWLLLLILVPEYTQRLPAAPPHDSKHDAHKSTSCQQEMTDRGAVRPLAARHH